MSNFNATNTATTISTGDPLSGVFTTTGTTTGAFGNDITSGGGYSGSLTIDGTSMMTTGTSINTVMTSTSTKYNLWGESFEIDDTYTMYGSNAKLIVSQLDVMGYKLWDSLKRNNIKDDLTSDLYGKIEELYMIEKRKQNLKSILD